MSLSKYRQSTAFPPHSPHGGVGWACMPRGILPDELTLRMLQTRSFSRVLFYFVMVLNQEVRPGALNHWCGLWRVWQPWERSNPFTHRGWLLFVLRSGVKHTHSKAAACPGSPDGQGVVFQEGSLLALNLGSWHQISWKEVKFSSHLVTSEGKLTCHPDAWNFSGLSQWGATSTKSCPFSFAETHLSKRRLPHFPHRVIWQYVSEVFHMSLPLDLAIQSGLYPKEILKVGCTKDENCVHKNVCYSWKLRINVYHEGRVYLKHIERCFASFTNISPTKLAKITELGTTLLVNVWALAHAHYGNVNLYGGQSGNIYKSENINSE